MEPQTNQTEVTQMLSADKKSFIGFLLSVGGTIFLLGGITFFLALLTILYIKPDLLIGLMVGSLITGITAFGVGSVLTNK